MDLLQTLLNAQGGQLVGQLGRNFGLDERQVNAALQQLVPLLSGGVRRNVGQAGGMEALLGALQRGNHARYVEDASMLGQPDTVVDGNAILGHLLGSKDVSRQVAGHAATATGIDGTVLKRLLPVVATMVMGAMSRQVGGGVPNASLGAGNAPAGASIGGMLTSLLDADRDGSAIDDVLGMFFRR
ncbi:MAG: DUF937 domain-containing protein [Gammaproteobacteria bacterium]